MDTPPPESKELSFFTNSPQPFPSSSTPCLPSNNTINNNKNCSSSGLSNIKKDRTSNSNEIKKQRRRHTIISRPVDNTLENNKGDDYNDNDDHEEESFDRISGILSNLIQEANNAVNGIEQEREVLWSNKNKHRYSSASMSTPSDLPPRPTSSLSTCSIRQASRLPRPRKTSTSLHERNDSNSSHASSIESSTSSLTNSSAPFSPNQQQQSPQQTICSPTTTETSFCSEKSPLLSPSSSLISRYHHRSNNHSLSSARPLSCPTFALPPTRENNNKKKKRTSLLLESFKRLDSSMALVDSLSKDLAEQREKEDEENTTRRAFNALFLVPILHIPHALVSILFDQSNNSVASSSSSTTTTTTIAVPSITGIVAWACLFALGNLMVDHVATTTTNSTRVMMTMNNNNDDQDALKIKTTLPNNTTTTFRRLSLPGSYDFAGRNPLPYDSQQEPTNAEEDGNNNKISPPSSGPSPIGTSTSSITATTTTTTTTTTAVVARHASRKRRTARRSVYRVKPRLQIGNRQHQQTAQNATTCSKNGWLFNHKNQESSGIPLQTRRNSV
ncbi:hypothetical protein INT45_008998 [Circinella minor]|uniref:Uncharacterized protein n=1 Tax=Circinella minor TaxID=1195481 RepID=A0A8H7VHP3_9FUNG|nr:hypothetical protein INT45_008998 [Circinella minor]